MPDTAPRKRGRPVRAERATILEATDQMLSADGAAAFSMRRLAHRLGVSTAAIYHHFPTKADLFFAVLNARAEKLPRPELPDDPRDRLAAIIVHLIDTLHEFPWIIDLLVTGETYGRAAMWILDEFVTTANRLGAGDIEAGYMYSVLWRFALGELIARKASADRRSADRRGEPTPHWTDTAAEDDLGEFPSVLRVLPQWQAIVDSYDSSRAVRVVVDGLVANLDAADITASSHPQ
ncbi:TetR/AcrR family transcriptional regulator [Nocardia flavorosea]|uniref:TetR/AcrR family transcriptional regulator n=1 Tax=Nocardia flavorosea TaxID=53429 RepID=UPI001895DB13|nr:TetR/AcrR family transcriptional regulator [Nocardia flavorosea]MBF6347404.1 TetR/AcrR family transcriptional regulator [Nocardia flavorosea]